MVIVVPVRLVTWRLHWVLVSADAAAAVAASVVVRSVRMKMIPRFFCFVFFTPINYDACHTHKLS
jgi:hypothetical protein